ncbi:MAG: hypothetical protein R2867_02600 [Caldilineaceae bacterium]
MPGNSQFALRSPAEMAQRFAEIPEAIQNTTRIAGAARCRWIFSGWRLPHFPTPEGSSEFAFLYQRCHAQLPGIIRISAPSC